MSLPLADPPAQIQTEDCAITKQHRTSRLLDAPSPLRLWHLASLDAPTVAVVWSLTFAHVASVNLPFWVPLLLALGTWAVYIGDRLLDARSAIRSGDFSRLRERHYFHWRRRRLLVPLAVTAAVAAATVIFILMPVAIRERDSALAVAALAYFSAVHLPRGRATRRTRFLPKEFLVGVLFTFGCALPTFSRLRLTAIRDAELWPLIVAIAFFAMLAWLNCHAIERWESSTPSHVAANASVLGIAALVLALIFHHAAPNNSALLIAGSAGALLLALLDRFRGRLTSLTLRAAADLALLTPIFLLAR